MLEPTKKRRTKSQGHVTLRLGRTERTFYGTQKQLRRLLEVVSHLGLSEEHGSVPWRESQVYADMQKEHGSEGSAYLAGCRLKHNMTQAALAAKLGIPRQNISEMERGKRPIGKSFARRLAEIFECDYRMFL